jgi:phospholipase C
MATPARAPQPEPMNSHSQARPNSDAALVAELQSKVKYVFVLYQENRSFDSYFGTFPGANGLFSQSPKETPGYYQPIINTDGSAGVVTPFRIGLAQYAADTDDAQHAHELMLDKIHVKGGAPRMDGYAMTEERVYSPSGDPSLQAKQFGELTMAHEDCDTIPIFWQYASQFTLFDEIFQEVTGPSTPGNIAIFTAQSGATQYLRHPGEKVAGDGDSGPGVPDLNDSNPFWGSSEDTTPASEKMPYNPGDGGTPQVNLTFASLPLTLQGQDIGYITASDRNPKRDLADIGDDLSRIAADGRSTPADWGWFQEGFDKEPTDPPSAPASGTHDSYVTHHNGPQYFGYLSNNPIEQSHFHGIADFLAAVDSQQLSPGGGVYYVKGGYQNIFGLTPVDPDPAVQANFLGDDEHPGYSDAQISEATVAEEINAIASSPYWSQSAIVITFDDSEGYYDHAPPPLREGLPRLGYTSDGPRVPLIVISPYAKTHAVLHDVGDQASVVKLVDEVFGLGPLADLPDEAAARRLGFTEFGETSLGPHDGGGVADIATLLDAFDPQRLAGKKAPVRAASAIIPTRYVTTLPYASGYDCQSIGVTPTDVALGLNDVPPSDFNPRPSTDPPDQRRGARRRNDGRGATHDLDD